MCGPYLDLDSNYNTKIYCIYHLLYQNSKKYYDIYDTTENLNTDDITQFSVIFSCFKGIVVFLKRGLILIDIHAEIVTDIMTHHQFTSE